MASLSTSFTQADGNLAAPWTDTSSIGGTAGIIQVRSNKGTTVSTTAITEAIVTHGLDLSAGNWQVDCDVIAPLDISGGGVTFECVTVGSGGYGFFVGNAIHIYSIDAAGAQTQLSNDSRPGGGGAHAMLQNHVTLTHASNGDLKSYLDGVLIATRNNVSFPSNGTMLYLSIYDTSSPTDETKIWNFVFSNVITGPATVPGQVTGLTATPGAGRVVLNWTAPGDGGSALSDYLIERAPDISGVPGTYAPITHGASTSAAYIDTGLAHGNFYWYRVSAINSIGTGAASTAVMSGSGPTAGVIRQEDGNEVTQENLTHLVLEGGAQGNWIGSGSVVQESGFQVLQESTSQLLLEGRVRTALNNEQGYFILTEAGDHLILESLAQPVVTQTASAALTTSASPSLTFATVPKADDLVIMWPSTILSSPVIQAVAGWVNPLGGTTIVASDAHAMACVYHVVTASEESGSTVTFTATNLFTGVQSGDVVGCVVRNTNTAVPIDGTGTASDVASTATPHILAAVTPTLAKDLVLSSVAKDDSTPVGTYTTPDGWNQLATSGVNQARWLGAAIGPTVASTTVGPTNITPSAADEYVSITIGVALTTGAVTLVVADATHGHVADNVALVVDLAVQSATHSHVADNIILVVDLAVQAATHSHVADSLTIGAAPAVQDSIQAHTADNVLLVVDLAALDASQAHSADNIVLTQITVTTLVVADATQAHTADALTLVASPAVQDATHAHIADNLLLVVDLVDASATHSHVADNIVLVVDLAVQAAVHAHVADNIALTVDLVVQDATHGHAADNIALAVTAVVQDATQAHVVDNIVLVVDLAIQAAVHGHTADNVAPGVFLVLQDALHAHAADNVVLVASPAVQDATHGHTAANVALGVDLVVQNATHAHTADNVVLGVSGSVSDAVHAQSADNIALGIPIFVAGATQAHVADNIVLLIPVPLFVGDATHAHVADNIPLIVTLAVADAVQVHVADNSALGVSLTVADATHGQTAENVALVVTLAVQAATNAHVADNVALGVSLAVDNAAHAQATDNVVLFFTSDLLTQDSTHGQTADNLDLSGTETLVVGDSIHIHTATSPNMGFERQPRPHDLYLDLDTSFVYRMQPDRSWVLEGTLVVGG